MLQLVLGRTGYGKTEYVFSSIKKLVENGEENVLLITPEQFSFISERRLLTDLGESKINCVDNMSFSRLSSEINKLYGGDELPTLTKGAKAVIMKKAIETVNDGLVLFNNNNTSNAFINSAIRIYDEMKSCRVSTNDILEASDNTDREILSRKLKDISLIIDAYDALIKDKYYDSADELTRLYHKLLQLDYFKDRYVFIDGFSGFVAQEYKILEVIIKQAKEVYITFCTDSFDNMDSYNLFSYVNRNIAILKEVTKKANARFMNPIILDKPFRFKSESLANIEKNAYSRVKNSFDDCDNINVYSARSLSDECDWVGMQISKLLRHGYGASDIAIICRDMQRYENEINASFRRYNISFYDDERQSIESQPLIIFVKFLLKSIIFSYRSDDILSMLKTGLTSLDNDSINILENYAFIWKINGSKWNNEFVQSPRGFVESISDNDKEILDEINATREYVVSKLNRFKNSTKDKSAMDICKALYYTLLSFNVNDKLKELAISLDASGKSALAIEQGKVWDILMDILDKLALISGDEIISIKEFYKLFSLMIANEDLGSVPSGLDNVQFGQADRIRCNNPRATFILGANEGEFPQNVMSAGLLSESDRVDLINNDFKLYSYGEILNAQEKYFAYMAMTSPSEKLFVSYRGGNTGTESSIVAEIKSILPSIKEQSYSSEISLDRIESISNAFDILTASYTENNEYVASLKEYFSSIDEYKGRIDAVERLVNNDKIVIKDKEISTKLFKKNMYLSASRIEDYYNCAFRYFCKFGVNARPRLKAEMNPMQTGTVIHYVLENILFQKGKSGLIALDDNGIVITVNTLLDEYLNNCMGESSEFTTRFKYQFMRLSKMLVYVIQRLRDEFEQSDFEPRAFELKIGNGSDNEPVKSKVIRLLDGGSIQIRGAIDRVDTYSANGKNYVRVVDYKSADKKFSLNDIINGLNLQMFIYLFNLCEDNNEYSGVSSGVLYMHSTRAVENMDRNPSESSISSKDKANFKMKGIILNDDDNDIAVHMERDLKGTYIPAKMTAKNGLTGNIATLADLGRMSRKIDALIESMGVNLHSGNISINPVDGKNHNKTCEYCDYSDVCKNYIEIEMRKLDDFDNSTVLNMLKEEYDNA